MEVLSKKLYLIETGYFKPSVGSIYIIDRNKDKELEIKTMLFKNIDRILTVRLDGHLKRSFFCAEY